jgi:RNA polymerase sigma factor (sigma-70 family)
MQLTNEELVRQIRDGQQQLMGDLYQQNRGMIYRIARRYVSLELTPAVDVEDFAQTGYLALAAAVDGYDESKGAFIAYLVLHLRQAMRRLVGLDGAHKAHNQAVTLDEPLPGSDGEATREDLLEDENAVDPGEAAELSDMQRIVRAAVDRLPSGQRDVLQNHYFNGLLYTEDPTGYNAAIRESRKAMAALHRDRALRRLWEEYETPIYLHVPLVEFKSTRSSAVEKAVIRRASIRARIDGISRPRHG